MGKDEFLRYFADLLDIDEDLDMEKILDEMEEWDSLAFVSFLAMADAKYHQQITISELKNAQNIGDLYKMVCV